MTFAPTGVTIKGGPGARGLRERRMASRQSTAMLGIGDGGIGRVAPRSAPSGGRSGPPESRPQLEELRSGERVTEPAARGDRGDRTPPSVTESGEAELR
jgi:hypothetical protein